MSDELAAAFLQEWAGEVSPKSNNCSGSQSVAPPEIRSGEWVGVLERRSYTYEDLQEAYKTGRYHEVKYGRGDGDQEDFITWLKRRCTPTHVLDQ